VSDDEQDLIDKCHDEWLEEKQMGFSRGQRDGNDEGYEIADVEVTYNSGKAIKCMGFGLATDPFNMGGIQEEWIPISQIHPDSEVREAGDKGKLVISTWLARAKKLID